MVGIQKAWRNDSPLRHLRESEQRGRSAAILTDLCLREYTDKADSCQFKIERFERFRCATEVRVANALVTIDTYYLEVVGNRLLFSASQASAGSSRMNAQISNEPLDDASHSTTNLRSILVAGLVLLVCTLALYAACLRNSFVNYDDPAYVTKNAQVLQGLSWKNIEWALTATVEANWHPVTWISHMASVQMFGINPGRHHGVSVLLHALNVLLVFLVLWRATAKTVRSAVVAGLFAIHPLNVECVAWVAEQKSLLSMFFMLLSIGAYLWYAEKRGVGRYLLVLLSFAIGLAAKPMIVSLPILLLLWDYWALEHRGFDSKNQGERGSALPLVSEKIPLFILSAASAGITIFAQRRGGALGTTDVLPLTWRIQNAIYSYVLYIEKGLWPSGLAVFYPHPEGSLAVWRVLAAGILILAVTLLTWRYRERHRYLLFGWLWYLVAMLPMCGIMQVGRQAMADRYAYLPLVGLFVIGVWGCADLSARLKVSKTAVAAVAAAVMIVYFSMAFLQIGYWQNSYTLFSHALAVTDRNGIAEDNLGAALVDMGRPDLAMPHFEAAVSFVPELSTAHYNLGVLQQQQNHPQLARGEYELALKYSTDRVEIAQAHSNLGFLWLGVGELEQAKGEFTLALQVMPDKQLSLLGRGMAEYRLGERDEAVSDLSRASEAAPLAQADFWLGRTFEDKGQPRAAIAAYEAALRLAPGMSEAEQRLNTLRTSR